MAVWDGRRPRLLRPTAPRSLQVPLQQVLAATIKFPHRKPVRTGQGSTAPDATRKAAPAASAAPAATEPGGAGFGIIISACVAKRRPQRIVATARRKSISLLHAPCSVVSSLQHTTAVCCAAVIAASAGSTRSVVTPEHPCGAGRPSFASAARTPAPASGRPTWS